MLKPLASSTGAVFTGACCLGFAPFLAGLSAIGAGFLVNDLILIPLFVVFLGITLGLLWTSHKRHDQTGPLFLGAAGAAVAFAALWFLVPLSYAGIAAVFAASLWDGIIIRQRRQRAAQI
jgi:mercuric ion transport protein